MIAVGRVYTSSSLRQTW